MLSLTKRAHFEGIEIYCLIKGRHFFISSILFSLIFFQAAKADVIHETGVNNKWADSKAAEHVQALILFFIIS